jgi:RNA polymerase sigma-70 factor, ECF subfamily
VTIPDLPGLDGVPHPHSPPDALLIRQVLAGQTDAFAALVDRYHAQCLRVATHLLADSDDAEDVVQDAFVRAYRHLGSYHERDKFGGWLMRILVNQCRTRATKNARYVALDPDLHTEHLSVNADDDALSRRAELAHAMGHLGPEAREALVLRFGEELSYEEMSALTGVGVSALKMRVQRACQRLRTLLTEHLSS